MKCHLLAGSQQCHPKKWLSLSPMPVPQSHANSLRLLHVVYSGTTILILWVLVFEMVL